MSNFITFITANWPTLLSILTGLAVVLAAIAKLTPTPKDDKIAAAILNFLNLLPQTAKQTYEEEKEDKPTPVL